MKPFDPPANANIPSVAWGGLPFWLHLPMASYAAAFNVAAYQARCWAAFHQTTMETSRNLLAPPAPMNEARIEDSPVMAQAAADMRSVGAAMFQAQMDAMEAFRRSA